MIRHLSILASAARTANGQSADFTADNDSPLGIAQFVVDVTAVAGTTPALTVIIEGLDPVSGKYFPLLTSAALNATGTTVLRVGPGLPVTANLSANDIMPKQYRVRYTITGTTPSFTFSIGATTA